MRFGHISQTSSLIPSLANRVLVGRNEVPSHASGHAVSAHTRKYTGYSPNWLDDTPYTVTAKHTYMFALTHVSDTYTAECLPSSAQKLIVWEHDIAFSRVVG